MICLLVMTDGRGDCLHDTMISAADSLRGPVTRWLIHDDSGDEDYSRWLRARYSEWEIVSTPGRSGFGGAIRSAWSYIAGRAERFVFHLEDDFTFRRPVDLAEMAEVLYARPYLMQLALRRQPWNDAEHLAGGIVEQHPEDFTEVTDPTGKTWLEHRRFFTTNPSLYRSELCRQPWPRGPESEGHFTHQLLASPAVRFGYWGAMASGEAVTHIGHERIGTGY